MAKYLRFNEPIKKLEMHYPRLEVFSGLQRERVILLVIRLNQRHQLMIVVAKKQLTTAHEAKPNRLLTRGP